jgi:PAS domain S-box-containing protein
VGRGSRRIPPHHMAETPAAPGAGAGSVAPAASGGGARAALSVLAVDDDADVLRATQRVLEEAGFHVLTGTTASAALELTRRHRPALVLLDVVLPDGNGLDVARQIKGDPALADVFVILYSGSKVSSDDQAEGLGEGLADGYMTRPLRKPELLARIDAYLRIRETQRALRESETHYRLLAESIKDVVWILDAETMCFRYVSPSVERLRGYTAEEIVARPVVDALPAETGAYITALTQSRTEDLLTGKASPDTFYTEEVEQPCKDGSTVWTEVITGYYVNPQSGRVEVRGVTRDITERKQAEDEIRRLNAELEERVVTRTAQRDAFNRELEAFAYSAAHDLRAPLRAIDGFSTILLEDAAERLTADDRHHLERGRAAAERMTRMIDDLMGLSKVAQRPLLRREVDVSAMAREVAEELRAAQPERRAELVVAPGMRAAADQALLRLVLAQLLGNAWKFTSRHAAARIEVGVSDAGGEPAFFVRDDGAGFDMASATQLFGAFQRFHAAGEFAGDGVGLATVQRLVLRHGGRVWAEAEVEKGATFFFTLPEAELAVD